MYVSVPFFAFLYFKMMLACQVFYIRSSSTSSHLSLNTHIDLILKRKMHFDTGIFIIDLTIHFSDNSQIKTREKYIYICP